MSTLTAPYRYVPFWETYFAPEWQAGLASGNNGPHDAPVQDGLSGEVVLEIETVTPLMIGGEQDRLNDGSTRKHWFELDGVETIPGSTVKGVVRSVLEIVTFGNFSDGMDERQLSIRDLNNEDAYTRHFNDPDTLYRPLVRAGWLDISGREWTLAPCDWALVKQQELEGYYRKTFSKRKAVNLGLRQDATNKYTNWGWQNREIKFNALSESAEGSFAKGRTLRRAVDIGLGPQSGTLVFTGQTQARRDDHGPKKRTMPKYTEFIFWGGEGTIVISPLVRRGFEQIHRQSDGTPNKEWGSWLNQAHKFNQKVPVFWLEDDLGAVKSMGLAMMYRLPYSNTLKDAAKQNCWPDRTIYDHTPMDLATLTMGRAASHDSDSGSSTAASIGLKGRVRFGHFQKSSGTQADKTVELPLLEPKPGFYAADIRQERTQNSTGWKNGGAWTTLQNENVRVRGAKRYMASRHTRPAPSGENRKVLTAFHPIAPGAVFSGKLRFFNLTRIELGALLWSIHLGGNDENRLNTGNGKAHMIGSARNFGYGACHFRVATQLTKSATLARTDKLSDLVEGEDALELLSTAVSEFEAYMDSIIARIRNSNDKAAVWKDCEQVRELLASVDLDHGDNLHSKRVLDQMPAPRSFSDAKKRGDVLPTPSGAKDAQTEIGRTLPVQRRTANRGPDRGRPIPQAKSALLFRAGELVIYEPEQEEMTVVKDVEKGETEIRLRDRWKDEDDFLISDVKKK